MIKFSFLGKQYQTGRVVGHINPDNTDAIVVFLGAIHGNEPTGLLALQTVFEQLKSSNTRVKGRLLGLCGNLQALQQGKRFIERDLNRIWTNEDIRTLPDKKNGSAKAEIIEQRELFEILQPILEAKCPVYVIDLHTTSAKSVPFIAINDQLKNRQFGLKFPVPTVLGIEEHLIGPLLSYVNEFGHVSLAFEAGRHYDQESVDSHVSFVYMALVHAGLIEEQDVPDFDLHQARLREQGQANRGVFEVIYRHGLTANEQFKMNPGYNNFSRIVKNEIIAEDREGPITTKFGGRIFMPLYQPVGNDGFFIVRVVPRWALGLSTVLRKINFEWFLTWLPGVYRSPDHADALVVNKRVARFLATELFHLLGYRRKKQEGDLMIFSRREIS